MCAQPSCPRGSAEAATWWHLHKTAPRPCLPFNEAGISFLQTWQRLSLLKHLMPVVLALVLVLEWRKILRMGQGCWAVGSRDAAWSVQGHKVAFLMHVVLIHKKRLLFAAE